MNPENLIKELSFKAVRSSGAGGQHVNKVSSKIELSFDVANSEVLTDSQKQLLYKNIATKLTNNKTLILFCDETRSQHKNKEIAISRFLALIKSGLKKPKRRKATKPTKKAVQKRLKNKKHQAEKKANRIKPEV
ncbi:MAG: aminoacyl-tRNA hydrolase [Flavobacteriales bacterium]|nr:MAG: aminoacyl-tRNA hydrolase [Flavobacteriales bacterium]